MSKKGDIDLNEHEDGYKRHRVGPVSLRATNDRYQKRDTNDLVASANSWVVTRIPNEPAQKAHDAFSFCTIVSDGRPKDQIIIKSIRVYGEMECFVAQFDPVRFITVLFDNIPSKGTTGLEVPPLEDFLFVPPSPYQEPGFHFHKDTPGVRILDDRVFIAGKPHMMSGNYGATLSKRFIGQGVFRYEVGTGEAFTEGFDVKPTLTDSRAVDFTIDCNIKAKYGDSDGNFRNMQYGAIVVYILQANDQVGYEEWAETIFWGNFVVKYRV